MKCTWGQLERLEERGQLLLRALRLFYGSLGAFAATALISIVGSALAAAAQPLAFDVVLLLGFSSGTLGVGGLVFGCSLMVREARLAVQNLTVEAQIARNR